MCPSSLPLLGCDKWAAGAALSLPCPLPWCPCGGSSVFCFGVSVLQVSFIAVPGLDRVDLQVCHLAVPQGFPVLSEGGGFATEPGEGG